MVTAAAPIVLRSSSGSLTLALYEKGVGGWCQVHLLMTDICRPLGAERLQYIATHLTSFLSDATPGQRWVLSLSELHTSAYGEHVAGEAIIHLQDADGKMFAKLTLTTEEKKHWMQALMQHTGA